MNLIDKFESFAAAFEACIIDDEWARIGAYFDEQATYWNVGGPDHKVCGRSAIIDYLRNDVSNNDRRFDSRKLQALSEPKVTGNKLVRRWRCTYTLAGSPDLVLEGEARYEFKEGLICSLEEEITPESMVRNVEWMEKFGTRLHAKKIG